MNALHISTSRAMARFVAGFDIGQLAERHHQQVGRALADTYAVAVAGLNEPASRRALRYVLANSPDGPARIWGTRHTTTAEAAALFNGISAHVLDYDDASSPMSGHPSVVLLPALIALGEMRASNARAVVAAYAVGFEVACKLGRALSPTHYERGWHLTSSIGTLASAMASAHLLGLDEEATHHAIGLAVAQAAGTRGNFGTDAKSYQAGHAASAGLRAALLAQTGYTAAEDAIDGPCGFTALYSGGENLAAAMQTLGTRPLELDASGIEIKKYPACYAVHRPLDGLLDLRRAHGLHLDSVASIRVETSRGALSPLLTRLPVNGLEGRFSMAYVLAAALADGEVKLASFTDEAVARPALRSLMARVSANEVDGTMAPRWAGLTVALTDGRVLSRRIDALRGAPELPLTDEQFLDKLKDCFSWGESDGQPASLLQAALAFDTFTVPGFMHRIQNSDLASPSSNPRKTHEHPA